MTLLDATTMPAGIVDSPLVHALGWTLVHFCWQGALVAVLLWCVLALLAGRSCRVRYGAACCALGLMVALPLMTFARIAAEEFRLRAAMQAPALDLDPGMVLQVGAGETAVPWTVRLSVATEHWMPWLLLAWCAGVAVCLVRLNLGFVVARRLQSAATEPAPAEMLAVFERLRSNLGVRRAVRLMQSAIVQVPTVIGWFRPVVLVPVSCLTGLSAAQIEAILCHELAHVRRHDYLVSVAQSVMEALLFYHPAVWWVSRQVRREREYCCDEVAVRLGGDRLAYARALSSLEEYRAGLPAIVLGANGGVLTMRIRRLLGLKESSLVSQIAAAAVLTVLVAVAGGYVATTARAERRAKVAAAAASTADSPASTASAAVDYARPAALPENAPTDPAPAELAQPYRNWLDQDVVWIIAPEERAAFLKLANDAERDRFIAQFWERRNAPGAPQNSFREQRIAYANERFATAGAPGWKTDRGHVFIAYGRPDSIDSHPAGGGDGTSPYEVWRYKAISVQGQGIEHDVDLKFVDGCRCGEYRLLSQGAGEDVLGGHAAATTVVGPASSVASRTDVLCPVKVEGNSRIPAASLLARLSSRAGGAFEPAAVERDFSALWSTGYFTNVRIERVDTAKCVQLVVHVAEKPVVSQVGYQVPAAGQAAAPAQGAGAIAGVVVDPTGAVVARAEVTAADTNKRATATAQTDESGRYAFAALPAGSYTVEADVRGFRRLVQTNVQVAAGEQVALNLKLAVGATSEVLDVTPASSGATGPQTQSGDSGPMLVSAGVMAGNLTSRPDPVYPPDAKAAHISGTVVLQAIVSKTGAIENLKVVSGPKELMTSAIDAVKRWTYKPYLLNGEPREVETTIRVNFTFGGDGVPPPPAPQNGKPLRVSGGTIAGNLISRVDPVYPADAKAAGVQGVVVLQAVIAKTGEVEDLKVVSGPKELVESAIDAVKQWVYKPYLLNGEPVEVDTTITVNYHLAGSAELKGSDVPDNVLYERGLSAIAAGQYAAGRQSLQTLVKQYPDSRYSTSAKMALARSLEIDSDMRTY